MNAPFSRRIKEAELPPKFTMPIEKYSGSEDPVSHLESFIHQMEIQNATWSAMCKMFLQPWRTVPRHGSENCHQVVLILLPSLLQLFVLSVRGSSLIPKTPSCSSMWYKSEVNRWNHKWRNITRKLSSWGFLMKMRLWLTFGGTSRLEDFFDLLPSIPRRIIRKPTIGHWNR